MDIKTLRTKYRALAPALTERSRRLWAATEALALGHGGIALVERASGISRSTVTRGIRELESGETLEPERTRRPGGGRKRTPEKDATLLADLEALVEPTASGDPDAPLRWTSKSVRHLSDELQANRKTREGPQHPDRDAQFRYINDVPARGKVIPYGVYDLSRNEGWVSVGLDHDTARFAVNAIRRWWKLMGRPAYPDAIALFITADAGGSNGPRVRLWKWELQQFANRTGLSMTICHFPPGTSKWHKIEHRLFSHIAMNWRAKPLVSVVAIVNLVGSTKTDAGLRVRSEIDHRRYPMGVVVTDPQMAQLNGAPHAFHGEWNYTIRPHRPKRK